MYNPEFCQEFTPFLDPDTFLDENGHIIDWKDRSLLKGAPQSAKDAFNKFKIMEKRDEKTGKIL